MVSSETQVAFHVDWKGISRMGVSSSSGCMRGEVFRCEAAAYVLAQLFCCEMVCLKLVHVVNCVV